MPAIISLETNEDRRLSARALALHAILHTKHASLVNSRFLDCAKATYEYQRKLCPDGQVKGRDGWLISTTNSRSESGYHTEPDLKALLQPWYSLVRDKRPARQEFIKSMVKAFSITSDELKQVCLSPGLRTLLILEAAWSLLHLLYGRDHCDPRVQNSRGSIDRYPAPDLDPVCLRNEFD
jgi:hypothetical protein